MDHLRIVRHLNRQTRAAWIFRVSRGESRLPRGAFLRRFRTASERCPRLGDRFGNAVPESAARRDKRWEQSLGEESVRAIQPERTKQTASQRSPQERRELFVCWKFAWRLRCGVSVYSRAPLPVYYSMSYAVRSAALPLADAVAFYRFGSKRRFCLRRVPISPIILSLSTDVGDSSDGWRRK